MLNVKLVLIGIVFLLGLYFVLMRDNVIEGMKNRNHKQYRCPNILIQKGSHFYLYNSKLAKIPGVNPLIFNNLEDYVEFTEWQRSQGIKCPVLYLQESYDAQGNQVFKAHPSPDDLQGGLPEHNMYSLLFDSSRTDPPFNQNSYPGFDPENQYIGLQTPLDNLYANTAEEKADPMSDDWAGKQYTQQLIKSGAYADDEVFIKTDTD